MTANGGMSVAATSTGTVSGLRGGGGGSWLRMMLTLSTAEGPRTRARITIRRIRGLIASHLLAVAERSHGECRRASWWVMESRNRLTGPEKGAKQHLSLWGGRVDARKRGLPDTRAARASRALRFGSFIMVVFSCS